MCQSADSIQPTKKQTWTNCNRVLKWWCHKNYLSDILLDLFDCLEQSIWKKFSLCLCLSLHYTLTLKVNPNLFPQNLFARYSIFLNCIFCISYWIICSHTEGVLHKVLPQKPKRKAYTYQVESSPAAMKWCQWNLAYEMNWHPVGFTWETCNIYCIWN